MKKKIIIILMMMLIVFSFSCSNKKEKEIKIAVPQGNPLIAVGSLIGEDNLIIDSLNGAAGIKTALVDETYDIVIAPLNLGAQLYEKGNSKYILDAIIAFGNTYIVSKSKTNLKSINDLEGKTILAYSRGGTPDIILQYALKKNNISANIEYMNSLSEVVPFFVQDKYDYILAAEPIITNLNVNKKIDLNILNLQDVIDVEILQAAIFVNPNVDYKNIKVVIEKIEKNIEYMNSNTENYVNEIVEKNIYFSDLGKEILIKSIPNSNLNFIKAKDNIEIIEKYLNVIGYKLPNEEFYN